MAEFLVRAITSANPDGYKRGDPIVVRPDGWPWGSSERPPMFFILRVPGVTVAEVEAFVQPRDRVLFGKQRRYTFDIDRLSPQIRSDALSLGVVTMTRTAAIAAMKEKP